MPMIDVYAPAGAFADKSQLARRVQVLTNAGALDRDKQIALVERLTALVSGAPGNPPPPEQSSIPVDQDLLCGLLGSGGVVGPFDEFAVLELRAGADERHEMGRVDRPPA